MFYLICVDLCMGCVCVWGGGGCWYCGRHGGLVERAYNVPPIYNMCGGIYPLTPPHAPI